MPITLDASAFLGWALADDPTGYADAAVEVARRVGAVSPAIFWYEPRNVLLHREQIGSLVAGEAADLLAALAALAALPVLVEPLPDPGRVERVARAHRLSFYDASYLETARRRSLQLATLDRALRVAAPSVGVTLFEPPARDDHA